MYWIQLQYPGSESKYFTSLSAAFSQAKKTKADICLFDPENSRDDWSEFIDEAYYRSITKKMLVLVGDYDEYLLANLRSAKLDAIVDLRQDGLIGMLKAIRMLLIGESYISPFFKQVLFARSYKEKAFLWRLTQSETLVLGSIGVGMSNQEIAEELEITPDTVQTHRRNIMYKLGISRAGELVAQGFRLGVVKATGQGLYRPGFDVALSSRNRDRRRNALSAKTGEQKSLPENC